MTKKVAVTLRELKNKELTYRRTKFIPVKTRDLPYSIDNCVRLGFIKDIDNNVWFASDGPIGQLYLLNTTAVANNSSETVTTLNTTLLPPDIDLENVEITPINKGGKIVIYKDAPVTEPQLKRIRNLIEKAGWSNDTYKTMLETATRQEASEIIDFIEDHLAYLDKLCSRTGHS